MKKRKILSLLLAVALCMGLTLPVAAYDSGTLGKYTTVSCGATFTAAIDTNGTLWMWGSNDSGELGNGGVGNDKYWTTNRTIQTTPMKILDNVVSVSCGNYHAAAIKTDGTLWMWGWASYGQFGNGTDGYDNISNVPIKVLDNVAAVSCGDCHTAVIKTDGSLWTFGYNIYGQLGNGTKTDSNIPVKIMDNVVSVSCGNGFTAAIKSDGSLWTWGLNLRGQIGNGGISNDDHYGTPCQTIPTQVLDEAAAVSCGIDHIAAVKTDGSLWTWGHNDKGQLGNGTTTDSNIPLQVWDNVAAVNCGGGFTAVVKSDGSLWLWGSNSSGQLGNAGVGNGKSSMNDIYQTLPVKVMDDTAMVSCGAGYAAAVKVDGTMWECGSNLFGQIGNGSWGTGVNVFTKVMDGVALSASAVVPTSPAVAGFTDVHESDYYAQAVAWAKENGVTSGTSTTTFSPAASVTRAEAVTFLWRAAGSPEPSTMVSPFTDVTDSSAYYYKAILWASEHDIAGGIGNNLFGLNNTLTYDQILALLCRTAGASASGSDWSAAAVTWATKNGLTDGLTFTAKDNCPRADVVYCLWKQLA